MIYVFMGKSSVGKDHIVKKVLENNKNMQLAVSHTTRPIRNGEKNGVEYHFISQENFMKKQSNSYFIETRKYNTYDLMEIKQHGTMAYLMRLYKVKKII